MKRIPGISALALGVSLALLAALAPEAGAQSGRTVKIGLVESLSRGLPPSLVRMVMQPFKTLMEQQTGLSGDVVAGGDTFALAKKMADDQVQVGVFHGHEFAWAKQKHPKLEPIAVCVNKQRSVRVLLVVNTTSRANSHADLAGKSLAYARTNRDHCRLYLEKKCVKAGSTPEKYFQMAQTADAEESLDQVVTGKAAGAVVDATAMEDYRSEKPGRSKKLRVLQQSEAFPPGVIAYFSGRFAAKDVRSFRDGLVNAKNTPRGRAMLDMLKLTAFEAPPSDFDTTVKTIAAAYPPPR